MKKITTVLFACASFFSFSQVNVTYQVDVTNYLASGASLAPNGLRVGGNFTTQGASVADWTPSDPSSAMTDLGGNLWSITVQYPQASIGNTQQYKFVNGDWGMNEGTDPGTLIAIDGCGTDDGSGNINRTLIIPSSDITVTFCWDSCSLCSATSSLEENVFSALSVTPNPAVDVVTFNFGDAIGDVAIRIYDLSGKLVSATEATSVSSDVNIAELHSGSYIYTVTTATGVSSSGKIVKL